jgi:NADH:ubiquinone oxidoreductase subunit K
MVILIFLDMLLLLNVFLSCVAALLVVGPEGYIYAFFILGTAAADTAVGLGLFILYYKSTGSVSL